MMVDGRGWPLDASVARSLYQSLRGKLTFVLDKKRLWSVDGREEGKDDQAMQPPERTTGRPTAPAARH